MAAVPTKQGMVVSNPCYVSSVRTTLCDIMCTVNASLLFNAPRPADSLKPLTATLPYKATKQQTIKKKVPNETLFQKLINSENIQRMDKELRRDREKYFAQLREEKQLTEEKRNKAATKIQALFRGFRKRKGPVKYIRRKRRIKVHTQNDMQDELCTLAAQLGLKPIDGLSLEARSKTSKRKEKIMNAAAFRLHKFMDMITKRSLARKRLQERREEILNRAARIITRAVRYVKVKKFVKRCENIKRQQMALKIQCRTRIFQAREKVRARAKERHIYAKRQEAAIIIQRNLAPKARAYNLARLAMVTMRTYQHIADEVVTFIESFLLEGGINSAVNHFTDIISDKFEVVHPRTEDRIFETLIDDAVVVEMHVWLEEQMLAILAENQRISEERMRFEAQFGRVDPLAADITWNNLPMEFYNMDSCDTPGGAQTPQHPADGSHSIMLGALHSQLNSRLTSPNVGEQAHMDGQPATGLLAVRPPSLHHRNNFLRSSVGGLASLNVHGVQGHSPMRNSITASFSISPQHYRNVMYRLSSVDMNHSVKYQAALLAANLAANGSFIAQQDGSNNLSSSTSEMGSMRDTRTTDGEESSRSPSVRFVDENTVMSGDGPASPLRAEDMLPTALEGSFIVQGIAECDEEEDEGASNKATPVATDLGEEEIEDTGSKAQTFDAPEPEAEPAVAAEAAPAAAAEDEDGATAATAPSQAVSMGVSVAEFAEAFASMSITSVLNQFGDSVVMVGDAPEDGGSTILPPKAAEQPPDTPHSGASEYPEYVDDGDNASDIASTYYDVSVAGSLGPDESSRPVEEWEVCRDFTAMSLTEQEKREIDQLFKDTMYAFYKAKYRKASDVLECFLPILRKFPSADPFHPDVARVQTTIKTIKARILFEQAQYADAKEVFDDALQHRIEVFGKAHYLCLELYYSIGEWHRSQAQYDAAEKYLHQASMSVAALIKMQLDATDSGTFDLKLWHAKNKIMIGQAELLKQSGQYYKANLLIQQLRESLKQRNCQDAETTRIQESFVCLWASILCINGKYNQAISLHQELLDQRRYRYGTKHPKVATSLHALGVLKLLRSEYQECSEMLEESLAMRREVYPADHPAIAASLCARGIAFARLGRFPEAAADITHSLEMRRIKLGSEHPAVAQSAVALADVQTEMGDPLRAWKNYNFALSVFRERYGVEKHRDIAQCLFSMACSAEVRGAYLEAVAYHEQALQLREAVLELFRSEGTVEVHLGVELSRVHLASMYSLVGRLEEAKGFMKEAVKNTTKILGNRNVLVAQSLCCLGQLCNLRGNYADAKQLYALAFNVVQQLFGDDHPLIATIMLLSADNLRCPGLYSEGFELELSAYDVRSYLFGSDNIYTALAVYQRAQLLRDSGKHSDAEKQYVRALHILVAKLGENNGLYGKVLGDYAECCRIGGKLDMAEKFFGRAIEIQVASYGEGSVQVAETLCNFALLLMDLHHPADAAEVLRDRVVPLLERLLGKAHPATLYAKANLALAVQFVRFFESQGTEEGSLVLEGVLGHPDIVTFMDALRGSSFAADHPWLLRFTEGSQSLSYASNSLGSPPPQEHQGGSEAGDSGSVHSSLSFSASASQDAGAPGQSLVSGGPESLESQTRTNATPGTGSFTPRESSASARLTAQSANQMDLLSPSDSDSYSQHSYGNKTNYTPSEASGSVAGSMTYSASQSSSVSHSYAASHSYSQPSRGPLLPFAGSNSLSTRGHDTAPQDSLSGYPEGSLEASAAAGSYQTAGSSYPSGSYPSGSYPSGSSYPSSGQYQSGSNYVSQHSAVIEYGDDYSVGSASASASVTASLTPRGYRGRRNFSLTPSAASIVSRQLTNYEESTIGSWDDHGSLDESFSRSMTLEEDSVGSMHTMDSLYHD